MSESLKIKHMKVVSVYSCFFFNICFIGDVVVPLLCSGSVIVVMVLLL